MLENVEEILSGFAEQVISESKGNLTRDGKIASGALINSFGYGISREKNKTILKMSMEDYALFIDKGVSGVKKKYNTPFSYKSKGGKTGLKGMPPPSAFDKWNIRKGRADRDEKGRFLSRKQLNFRTAVGIFNYGIKPTKFFTTPFENAFASLPKEIVKAYGDDLMKIIEIKLNTDANI